MTERKSIIMLALLASIAIMGGCILPVENVAVSHGYMDINATISGANFSHYNISLMTRTGVPMGSECIDLLDGTQPANDSLIARIDTGCYPDGKYIATIYAYDHFGDYSTDKIFFAIDNIELFRPIGGDIFLEGDMINVTGSVYGDSFVDIDVRYRKYGMEEWAEENVEYVYPPLPFENEIIAIIDTTGLEIGIYEVNMSGIAMTGYTSSDNTSFVVTRKDDYEPDDIALQAAAISPGEAQQHTYHAINDTDWLRFEAVRGMAYNISFASIVSTPVIWLYDGTATKNLRSIHSVDGAATISWGCPQNGTYYIKSAPSYTAQMYSTTKLFGDNYSMRLSDPILPFRNRANLTRAGVIGNSQSGLVTLDWSEGNDHPGFKYSVVRHTENITMDNIDEARVLVYNFDWDSYSDMNSEHGVEYWYAIRMVDVYGRNTTNVSASFNATAYDRIKPRPTYRLRSTAMTNKVVLAWSPTQTDVLGNWDYRGLTYKIWAGTSYDSSKKLINDTLIHVATVDQSSAPKYNWSAPPSCRGGCQMYFAVTAEDDGGNNNYENATVVSAYVYYTAPPVIPRSGGSGGGGGGSAGYVLPIKEDPNRIKEFMKYYESVRERFRIDLYRDDLPVTALDLDLKQGVSGFTIRVAGGNMSGAPSFKADGLYDRFFINATAANGLGFDTIDIRFRVNSTWLASNGLAAADMALYMHGNGTWSILNTTPRGEDGGYIYFSALTQDMTYFAIAARPKEVPITADVVIDTKPETVENVHEEAPDQGFDSPKRDLTFIWLILGSALAALLIFKGGQAAIRAADRIAVPQALVTYVHAALSKGVPDFEIQDRLSTVGWKQSAIRRAKDMAIGMLSAQISSALASGENEKKVCDDLLKSGWAPVNVKRALEIAKGSDSKKAH